MNKNNYQILYVFFKDGTGNKTSNTFVVLGLSQVMNAQYCIFQISGECISLGGIAGERVRLGC